MKKIRKILALALACLCMQPMTGCSDRDGIQPLKAGNEWTVASPDGSLCVNMSFSIGKGLTYSVRKDGAVTVEKSNLGFEIDEDDFSLMTLKNVGRRRVKGSYKNKSGRHSVVGYDCNETAVTLKGWTFYLNITMRAYDDGYAFRYGIKAQDGSSGNITVKSEKTQFALPENSPIWAMPYASVSSKGNYFSYEGAYMRRTSSSLAGEIISMPVMYRIRGRDIYSVITESGLIGSGYYGSFIAEADDKRGTGILQTVHTPAGCAEKDDAVAYPFESPWRIGITGSLKTVQESELVEKVYDDADYWKPDDYDALSEADRSIYDYDWVETGPAAWSWLLNAGETGQNNFSMQYRYADLAAKMGWKYIILDGGWNGGLDEGVMKEFCRYSHKNGVKVIVWCDALADFGNGSEAALRGKLDIFRRYGVDGIKIDFFDGQTVSNNAHQGEDIGTIKWYETVYRECARRRMVVNCHGSNKPTGERRIYPNVINREAILGNEVKLIGNTVIVNQLFIRNVTGPSDFTPVVCPLSSNTTMAGNMAVAVLFESGIPSMADMPETYLNNPVISEFFKSIPSLRDETVFLCGEPDEYYVAAVRAGDDWFVAGLNSVLPVTADVDFSFLGEGSYEADIMVNDADDGNAVVTDKKIITKDSRESISMIRSGGFVYRLKSKK